MRIGSRKRPYFRVVAVDERKKRTGAYLDLLGTYNPLTEPKEIILNQVKIDEWIKKGAVLSDGFLRIIGKAPQRPPRKAKKEKVAKVSVPKAPEAQTVTPDEAPAEEPIEKVAVVETETIQDAPPEEVTPASTDATQPTQETPVTDVKEDQVSQPEVENETPESVTEVPQRDETEKVESLSTEEKS